MICLDCDLTDLTILEAVAHEEQTGHELAFEDDGTRDPALADMREYR